MSKASRFRRSLLHRKHETLRQYILRARDEGLWPDEVAKEGLLVWLNTYDSVRFGGIELSEGEFLATMKLVYYLLREMKPLDGVAMEYAVESVVSSSSSSSFSHGFRFDKIDWRYRITSTTFKKSNYKTGIRSTSIGCRSIKTNGKFRFFT